jgi:ABC-2 type transport system ATP-binding protein
VHRKARKNETAKTQNKEGYAVIEVSHLTKKYGSHLAVNDLSFTVEEGQIYGLLGPNGAGKSTIMNILTGYLSATSGTVTVDGHPIPEEAEAAKRCVGYLPEQPPLYPEMTVEEYLLFVAELKKVARGARRTQVEDAARRTGLEKVMPRPIRNLSKGYRQRIGVAQALLGSPKVIILDEPTVGLDPAQVIELRTLIRELGKTHTVILSSHILSEVQAVCDQVLILAEGQLVAVGTPEELSARLTTHSQLHVTALGSREEVLAAVNAVPGLVRVEVEREQNGEVTLVAESASDEDKRAAVSRALSAAGCTVLALHVDAKNLEEVFLELTEKPAAQAETTKADEEVTEPTEEAELTEEAEPTEEEGEE